MGPPKAIQDRLPCNVEIHAVPPLFCLGTGAPELEPGEPVRRRG